MQQRITVDDGEVTIEVLDGQGTACRAATQPFVDRLVKRFGIDPLQIKDTELPAMHQPAAQTQTETGGQHLV